MPFGVLIEQAIAARLTCLLADWLTRDGHAARLPRTMRDFLQTQLRAGRHRWRLHHRETARVVAALGEQGTPAAAVNGIASASLLYDGRGTRQYTDADILIPPGATGSATQIPSSHAIMLTVSKGAAPVERMVVRLSRRPPAEISNA